MDCIKDLAYRPGSDLGLLDLYLPDGEGPFPVVVAIHGGAWRQGEKERMREYGDVLAGAGIAAVAPNHRLTTTHRHPAQQDDILAVLEWIASNAAEHGLDPTRIGITGSSSGGHLTALVGLKATSRDRPAAGYTVRCMMPICGVHDIAARRVERPSAWHINQALVGEDGPEQEATLLDASPIENIHPDAPPCLAVHGADDEIIAPAQSERLVEALKAVGAEADVLIVPGAGHGRYHPNTDPHEPLGGADVMVRFFTKHLCGA
jgi:acetyl esterase/lipase